MTAHLKKDQNRSIIEVKDLHKSFGDHKVLDGVSFKIAPNQSLGIIGGSGSGKSVLLKCILGLINPDKGQILINGEDLTSSSLSKRQSLIANFGMLFQGGALFDSLPIWHNVAFGLLHCKRMSVHDAKKVAIKKLKAVELDPAIADIFPAELSGGMQKRVALARAIATNPHVVFFDEPTAGLDPIVSGAINDLIRKSVKDLGASAITITHDMHSLREIADEVALLFKGQIIWQGTIEQMDKTDNPYVDQFIHGKAKGPFTNE